MASFQKIVLISAIVILIIALVFIGVSLIGKAQEVQWPPLVADCPDYWVAQGSGTNLTCSNVKDLGICRPSSGGPQTMNFAGNPAFTGDTGACAKYTWANSCKVSWDGITYGANNPCSTA
jgi:hypothetical protein